MKLLPTALIALALLAAPAPAAAAVEELTPVIGNSIASPEPVLASDGRRHLAYELQLINRSPSVVTVRRLEALSGGRVLEALSGNGLQAVMAPYGQDGHSIRLGAGQGAYVLMDIGLPRGARVPSRLEHRISVSMKPPNPAVATRYELAPTRVTRREALVVAPPLRGAGWVVANGCCADFTAHRGTVLPVDGAPHVAERFAIDFVQVGPAGTFFSGPRDQLSSYPYFGAEVLSATPGKVVGVVGGIPETRPGGFPPDITAARAGGNHVVVAIGKGRFAFYAHLQPGSIRVRVGQRVRTGQTLGLLGNSGNSDGPHLHFHVMDSPRPLASNGLPFRFRGYAVQGRLTDLPAFEGGAVAAIAPEGRGPQRRTLPLDLQVVDFPG